VIIVPVLDISDKVDISAKIKFKKAMLDRARKILTSEAQAIQAIPLSETFEESVKALISCRGKLITTGIGKAGYVARKAASTFSTTGSPSIYLHPGDASHGDVGVIGKEDILFAFSNSGGTREVLETVHFCKSLGISAVISVTGNLDSVLAKESSIILDIGTIKEPCPLEMTPSASTAAMLAISDALALVTMEERGFSKKDFALRHHGGYLGEKSREES
jgi:arabinose-5-phosphate isomerase